MNATTVSSNPIGGTRDTGLTRTGSLTSGDNADEDTLLGVGRKTEDWSSSPRFVKQEKEQLTTLAPRHNQLLFCRQGDISFFKHVVNLPRCPLLAAVNDQRLWIVNQPFIMQGF